MIHARLASIGAALVAIAGLAVLSACGRSRGEPAHESLSSVDPLRQAFNADSGKVRAIFLASPT
jgi:hypothetical protein